MFLRSFYSFFKSTAVKVEYTNKPLNTNPRNQHHKTSHAISGSKEIKNTVTCNKEPTTSSTEITTVAKKKEIDQTIYHKNALGYYYIANTVGNTMSEIG